MSSVGMVCCASPIACNSLAGAGHWCAHGKNVNVPGGGKEGLVAVLDNTRPRCDWRCRDLETSHGGGRGEGGAVVDNALTPLYGARLGRATDKTPY